MFASVMNHLWQSTLFAAGVALVVLLTRSNGAHVRYWLWWCASVKFLVPFSLLAALGRALAGAAPIYVSSDVTAAVGKIAAPVAMPLSTVLGLVALGVWVLGFVAVLTFWAKRARQLRAALASAEGCADFPLEAGGPAVRYSRASFEPGIVGIFRPVLLLPRGIAERLTHEQLGAVVEHELCHCRRRDNLTAAVHMVVEAAFWFHPLVWWIGARLIDERERACDEAVVRAGHDRRTYAEGILNVCELYVATPLTCAAGVSGADLKLRVTNIMGSRIMNELNLGKRILLGAAALGAFLVPITVGLVKSGVADAQNDADLIPLVRIAPVYPPEALQGGLEGFVTLEFTVTRDGMPSDISVVESSSPLFEQPSIDALSKWRYRPKTENGEPVERTGTRTVIRFALTRDEPAAASPENEGRGAG
jgi:bla regulator protein blaR1